MKKIICILCCVSFIFTLSACGAEKSGVKAFDKNAENGILQEPLIAENENYRLEFDETTCGVVLTDLKSGEKWGTSPSDSGEPEYDDYGMPIKKHPKVQSPISIRYRDYENNSIYQATSFGEAVDSGRVRCARGKDSLLVEFYFDAAEIMVPVEYKLLDDSVQITVDPERIEENKNTLFEITVAPFWCSVKNDTKDAYVFVPSGQGAIINADLRSQMGDTFTAPIYGRDYANELKTEISKDEGVKLPVFGVRMGAGKGALGIVTEGSESGIIEAVAGAQAIGYTSVYTSFQVRGYTEHTASVFIGKESTSNIYSDLTVNKPFSVRYYPLTGDKADYNGMAECYRDYLIKEKKLSENKDDVPFAISFIGGTEISKSFLGIPYKSFYTTTTLEEAEAIETELYEKTGAAFPVTLTGFGKSGIDIGSIAGAFTVNKNIGGTKALKSLKESCAKNGGKLYMDFDLMRFSKSSLGFSTGSDTVYDATNKKALQYLYNVSTKDYNKKTRHYLLTPSKLTKAADKLLSKTKKFALDGISVSTLTSMVYSDYKDKQNSDYYCCGGIEKTVSGILTDIKKAGRLVAASDANAYAAVRADFIADAALSSSQESIFTAEIPFYQLVFKGYVPMVSQSLNLTADYKQLMLKAVEGGCGLGYTLTAKWDNRLIDSAYPVFYNSTYEDIGPIIIENYEKLKTYYDSIKGAHITSHKILNNGVRETVFDNNTTVYVNLSETALASPAGNIAPYEFKVKEGV